MAIGAQLNVDVKISVLNQRFRSDRIIHGGVLKFIDVDSVCAYSVSSNAPPAHPIYVTARVPNS